MLRFIEFSFICCFFLALLIHVLGLFNWDQFIDKQVDIPFKPMHIRLGSEIIFDKPLPLTPEKGSPQSHKKQQKQQATSTPAYIPMEHSPTLLQQDKASLNTELKHDTLSPKEALLLEQANSQALTLKSQKRHRGYDLTREKTSQQRAQDQQAEKRLLTKNKIKGSVYGNSLHLEAESLERYTQIVSATIEAFLVYPDEAVPYCLVGAKPVIYIEVTRKGDIVNFFLKKSTGHRILDDAILKAVESANPLIPIPTDYARGEKRLAFDIYGVDFAFSASQLKECN